MLEESDSVDCQYPVRAAPNRGAGLALVEMVGELDGAGVEHDSDSDTKTATDPPGFRAPEAGWGSHAQFPIRLAHGRRCGSARSSSLTRWGSTGFVK